MRDGDASEQSVYGLCLRTFVKGRFCICPVKGRAGVQWTTSGVVVESSAQVRGFNIPVYHYDDWAMKSDLNVRLSSDPAKPSPLARRQPRIVFPRASDVTDDLIEHLTAERIVEVEKKDRDGRNVTKRLWRVPEGRKNDWWDCLKWLSVLHEIQRKAAAEAAMGAA